MSNTSINSDKCAIAQRDQSNLDWSNIHMTQYQRPSGPIPLVPGLFNDVSKGPLKNVQLENNLLRGNQLLSHCDGYAQQQVAQQLGNNAIAHPWQPLQAVPASQAVNQINDLSIAYTRPARRAEQDDLDALNQQAFASLPWAARGGRATAANERPLDFSIGQDTYLASMQQLEAANKQEIDAKRAREAQIRQWYRQNPQPISTPFSQ